jgi:hypothetical protein
MANIQPISLINPVLEDKALGLIQSHLETKIHWLDKAYGRASKLAKTNSDNRTIYYPGYPSNEETTGKEYIILWPDEHLGNFCFFDLRDEQVLEEWGKRDMAKNIYRFGASLIFSFNLRTIYGETYWKNNTTANVVNEVFILGLSTFSSLGVSLVASRYFENTENVYRSYTHNEVKNQFNMRPYGCCRIDLEIRYSPDCLSGIGGGGLGIGYDVIEGGQIVYPT